MIFSTLTILYISLPLLSYIQGKGLVYDYDDCHDSEAKVVSTIYHWYNIVFDVIYSVKKRAYQHILD